MRHGAVVDSDVQAARRRTAPTGATGFWSAVAVNLVVAATFWFAVTNKYGFGGYGAISYHYEEWLWPTTLFLAVAVISGLVALAAQGWRRFDAGLISGAVLVGLLDLGWTLIYFVSQGS